MLTWAMAHPWLTATIVLLLVAGAQDIVENICKTIQYLWGKDE